jgi:hypothetical protein
MSRRQFEGRTHGNPPAEQDRSRRRGPQDRHPLWLESRDVFGADGPRMACGRGRGRGAAVPLNQSARASASGPVIRHRRGACRQETGRSGGPRSGQVRGTFAPGRARDKRGDRGRVRAVDHETNWASERANGQAPYPGWQFVPRAQRGEAPPVGAMTSKTPKARLCAAWESAGSGLYGPPGPRKGHRPIYDQSSM